MDPIDQAFSHFPRLESEHFILRRILHRDADDLLAIFCDEEVTRYYDLYTMQTLEEVHELIDYMADSFDAERQIRWAISRKTDNKLIGTCGFVTIHRRRAEIGYDLVREYWGQGIMREALDVLLAYSFETLALNRIEALVMPGNERSAHLLKHLGFTNEGTLRDYDYFKDAHQDLQMFSLLAREFRNGRHPAP